MKLWTKLTNWLKRSRVGAGGVSVSGSTDTEFTAEVVRVTQVLPHPNADRLEILRFEMAGIGETTYEVVSQKGSFAVGDLAAYFSVDCLLPTSHPDFAFLKGRLDGAGKDVFRLKAARLRGVFSQGLLVPCPAGMSFGEGCAEHFGVTYYRAPEPDSWSNAPSSTKKPRPQTFPIYGVDSLKKMPRLFEDGEPIVVTEKIHGTNFRFGWVRKRFLGIPYGWKFVVGSHRVIKGDGSSGYYGEDVWMDAADRMDLARKTWDYRGYTFYGELYGHTYSGQKIQDLTYGRKPSDGPGLAVFDIRTPEGKWMPFDERLWALVDCDLPDVPLMYIGNYDGEFVKSLAEGKSALDPKQIREGVVVESHFAPLVGPRRKAKYVGEGYLTRKGA